MSYIKKMKLQMSRNQIIKVLIRHDEELVVFYNKKGTIKGLEAEKHRNR